MQNNRRILCVGMCVFDIIYKYAEYPEEDTKFSCTDGYWARGGNASNNCTVLDLLGAKCEFFGFITDSPKFSFLKDDFQQSGIIIENCPTTTMYPPYSSIVITQNGTRTIFHCRVPDYPRIQLEHFTKLSLSNYKWIHLEGRKLSPTLEMIEKIQKYNEERMSNQSLKIRMSVELEKHTLSENLIPLAMNVNIIFISKDMSQSKGWLNARDACYGLRKELEEELKSKCSNNEMSLQKLPHIICPWGEKGADCLSDIGEWSTHPAKNILSDKIIDTLGAGDTFIASFIHGFCNLQKTLKESVDYANQVAGFKIQHIQMDHYYIRTSVSFILSILEKPIEDTKINKSI